MTDTPNRPPLWEVMRDAYELSPLPVDANLDQIYRNVYAAEIRALRDWLVPQEEPPTTDDRLVRDWTVKMRLRDLLTAEADRAERGDG